MNYSYYPHSKSKQKKKKPIYATLVDEEKTPLIESPPKTQPKNKYFTEFL